MEKKNKKILVIRTGAIGDVVHTTNLIHSVKKSYPDTIIHYMTNPIVSFLLKCDENIEKVIEIDPKFKLFSKYTINIANELKQEKYDLAINLQPSFKIRGLLFLAGIHKELIYKKDFKMHAVKNFWETGLKEFPLMKEEKQIKIYLSNDAIQKAKESLKNYKRPFVVINAGGVFSKRQGRTYPIGKWIELGNKIQDKYDGTIILNGSEEDKEFLKPLENIKNSVNNIGILSLEDSCAVISQADLMISGDSGPLHIATALGVKSIGLYGSMPVNRTGCYCNGINIKSKKDCVPCNRRKCKYIKGTKKLYTPCMEEIDINEILENINL
ncbi:glycosyltransferase family 9 protein [bacterium]|nr:glycosyltransferase family 9 protein [bacterium]